MKKIICLLLMFMVFVVTFSTTKTITTPGTLNTMFTEEEQQSTIDLVLNGNIDARDFRYIRDFLPNINSLDLSNVNVNYYKGKGGPLTNIIWEYNANTIPCNAFESKPNLSLIKLPLNITTLCNQCFSGCGIYNIDLPNSLIIIEVCAFLNCINLDNVIIPNNVTTIQSGAFINCLNLSTITIGESVTNIGVNVFRSAPIENVINNSSLDLSLIIPNVTIINDTITNIINDSIVINDTITTTINDTIIVNDTLITDSLKIITIFDTINVVNNITVIDTILNVVNVIDSIKTNIIDTVLISKFDTIQVYKIDTLYETLYNIMYDTIQITQIDTIYSYLLENEFPIRNINIYIDDNKLYINNLTGSEYITINYPNGNVLYSGRTRKNELSIDLMNSGVYIITVDKQSRKLLYNRI